MNPEPRETTEFIFLVGNVPYSHVTCDTSRSDFRIFNMHFFCPMCGLVWARRLILNRKDQHDAVPYTCPTCPKKWDAFRSTQPPWEPFGEAFAAAHLVLDLLTNGDHNEPRPSPADQRLPPSRVEPTEGNRITSH